MKNDTIIIILFTILFSVDLHAQPLPPTNPYGNPVPLGAYAALLLVVGAVLLLKKKKQ